jgi:hypothetical protein
MGGHTVIKCVVKEVNGLHSSGLGQELQEESCE